MLWKRQIPILIVSLIGFATLLGWFFDQPTFKSFVDDDATQWFDILAAFAIFLGGLNLLKLQTQKVLMKQKGWQYSLFAIGGLLFAIVAGFFIKGNPDVAWGAHVTSKGTLFKWMFNYMVSPMQATMFALLAFYVASASYRAFRIRNFEATLLLSSGIIIMIGRVPLGSYISSWFILYLLVLVGGIVVNTIFKNKQYTAVAVLAGIILVTVAGSSMGWPVDKPAVFYLPYLQEWIYRYPNSAGSRSIMIGIGLGIFGTSIRYILGIERSYICLLYTSDAADE